MISEKICVITLDGRTLVGTLESVDNITNLVLSGTVERVIKSHDDDEESYTEPLGVYLLRGDNVACAGPIDEELDNSIDWTKVRGEKFAETKRK